MSTTKTFDPHPVPIICQVGVDPRDLQHILSILHRVEDAPRNGRINEVLRADAISMARKLEGALK